ncbi:MAG: GxxExxY protein [Ferruginibacter sp.]|nr:GxxExxY protein [Bacteroidota bacterium]MBX2917954.1 GxxExxY protein [Ferruginibacter sp.]MCB0708756.1 GxxExxY protein [Chitinophagaceae bacterium]MCC7379420.1 GxxExxY protein [Chitinophagaceae bacterium]
MIKDRYNELATEIVDACFHVHKELGPGLLESAYEFALLKEFELRNIIAYNQVQVKLFYKGYDTGKHYAIDILVENEIVIEIKCCDVMHPVYTAQIISYLKLSQKKLGFLVNFHIPLIKDGIKRFVNEF